LGFRFAGYWVVGYWVVGYWVIGLRVTGLWVTGLWVTGLSVCGPRGIAGHFTGVANNIGIVGKGGATAFIKDDATVSDPPGPGLLGLRPDRKPLAEGV